MKTKEQCYEDATLKLLSDPNGTRMDIIYEAMDLYRNQEPKGVVYVPVKCSERFPKEQGQYFICSKGLLMASDWDGRNFYDIDNFDFEFWLEENTLPIADIKSVCKHDYVKTGLEGELYCYKCNSTLPIADSDNELDSLNFDRLKTLLSFSKKYEISVQFWPDQTAVYISKDGVELKSYGGGFKFAVQSSIDYLNRINNIG